MALTGVQVITPALPAIQDALALSDSQVALVTSVFLLPGVLLSIPLGFLTGWLGRRRVLTASLLLLGVGGVALLFIDQIAPFLVVRFVQGVAFAAILPTTITLIGDLLEGPELVRAQGRRNIAMAVGESGFPLLGGALVGLAWYAPFAVQLVALPVAVLAWLVIVDTPSGVRQPPRVRALVRQMRGPVGLSIQAAGMLRFLFKFAMLSYLPILLADRGASVLEISLSLSALSVAGIVSASAAPRIVTWAAPSTLMAACLLVIGTTMAIITVVPIAGIAIPAMLVLGFADVLYAVLQNAITVTAVPAEDRAPFVAATSTMRNFGKFAAPSLIGGLLLVTTLDTAFLVLAALAVLAIPSVLPLRPIDAQLQSVDAD